MVMKMLFLFLISLNKIMNLSSSQVLLPIKLVIPDTSTLFCLSNSIFIYYFLYVSIDAHIISSTEGVKILTDY